VLKRPRDTLDRGCFRGSFGTLPKDPANEAPKAGDLVLDLPFRAHDRYNPRVDSLEGVFFEAARELPGAYVQDVTWDSSDDPRIAARNLYAEVRVALRVDGGPAWDSEEVPILLSGETPSGVRDKLYLLRDPTKANKLLLKADRIELRVYPTFKQGAFENDAWKTTSVVDAVRVGYRRPIRVRRREELVR
jgi:hypothetical protein